MTRKLPLLYVLFIISVSALSALNLFLLTPMPTDAQDADIGFVLPERGSGRPLQSLYRVEAIAAHDGWTPERLRLAGDLWREAGDFRQTLAYWQAAAQTSDDETLLRDIAQMALELQDWNTASDALQRLVLTVPDDAWVNLQLGLLQAPFNFSNALPHLEIAAGENAYAALSADMTTVLEHDPVDALAVGLVLADHELWSFAELAFRQAADQQGIAEAFAYVGFARDHQDKEGTLWLDQALALAPQSATVRLLQGLHLRLAGEIDASLNALIAAATLDPENPVMYAELGTAYQLAGDFDQARRWLEQALALSDDDTRYQQLLDALSVQENNLMELFGIATEEADAATAEPNP